MPTVAEQLRNAREIRKLTVAQVAETTKIRTDHIRALEQGDYDVFVAPVYIRGFVRSYAALVKLDVGQIMADLDTELGHTEKFREPPRLSDRPKGVLDFVMLQLSQVNWGKTLLVLGALAIVGVAVVGFNLWRSYRHRDPLANLPPAVANTDVGQTLPLPKPTPPAR